MTRLYLFIVLVVGLSSCSNSKNLLIERQSQDISQLKGENANLKKRIRELESTVNGLNRQIADLESDSRLGAPADVTVPSQRIELESLNLTGLNSYLRGGIERPLGASESEMDAAIECAISYLGTPHLTGGTSKRGIDCSGLIQVSLTEAGIIGMPRTANEMGRYGVVITDPEHLGRGDLVFFTNTYNTSKFITHVGLHLGNGEFIHTSSSKGVIITRLDESSYWKDHYVFGTRIIE